MSDILGRARQHFEGQKNRKISVPEWGEPGQPAKFGEDGEIISPAVPGKPMSSSTLL